MKRFTYSVAAFMLFTAALSPAAAAVDFDELRQENRDKSAVIFTEHSRR